MPAELAPNVDLINRLETLSPARLKLLAVGLDAKLRQLEYAAAEPIAVIGMAGRYPSPEPELSGFWRMLSRGEVAFAPPSPERVAATNGVSASAAAAIGGYLPEIDRFDSELFRMSDREAAFVDPQQRLLLEVAWTALEHAGIASPCLDMRVGVYVGICTSDYGDLVRNCVPEWRGHYALGNAHGIAAGRLSRMLGLTGPSVAVNTACSSSLVAAHMACVALRAGECDMALVGGVNVIVSDFITEDLGAAGLLSAAGRCRPFDAAADGYVRGEGCGVLVFKRLSDAERAGDRIAAVIKGSATSHDGAEMGLAPSGAGQRRVVEAALRAARAVPAVVGYVEASSVGAPLADPVEANMLADVFGGGAPLRIGSLKAQIGHLEAASGVAALTKVILMLGRSVITPTPGFGELNPHIDWTGGGIRIATEETPWPANRPLAGVSSFSISGACAHIVLAPAPEAEARLVPAETEGPGVLALSAASPLALARLHEAHALVLTRRPETWRDLCHTVAVGRAPLAFRQAIVARTAAEAVERLRRGPLTAAPVRRDPSVALVFPAKLADAGAMLESYRDCPPFAEALDGLRVAWRGLPAGESLERPGTGTARTVAVQMALARMLRGWGVTASVLTGSGAGAIAAALVAGLVDAAAAAALLDGRPAAAIGRATLPVLWAETGAPITLSTLNDAARGRINCRAGPPNDGSHADGAAVVIRLGAPPTADRSIVPIADGDPRFARATLAGALFEAGLKLDWRAVMAGTGGRLTDAPTYPFAPSRCWVDTPTLPTPAMPSASLAVSTGVEEAREIIGGVIAHELGIEPPHGETNLVDIGATSTELMRTVASLEARLGFRPALEPFFREPSLDGLVRQYRAWLSAHDETLASQNVEEGCL